MNPDAYIEMDKTESTHWWFVARRLILSDVIKSFKLPPDAKILEIGCGTGGNLEMLSQFGDVSGLEMDQNAIDMASKKSNNHFDIRLGCCPVDTPFRGKTFDLICMFDVLEHIEDDVNTLKSLNQLLTDNGYILITVPAYKWLWGPHDKFMHHKRRYVLKELSEKIKSQNFFIRNTTYFNTLLFPLAALVRFKERFFKNSYAAGRDVPPSFLNLVFKYIFSLEKYILRFVRFPFGVSIMLIAQKK